MDRLARSAAALDIALPARADLEAWSERVAADAGDCAVRVLASGGPDGAGSTVVVLPLAVPERAESLRLRSVPAPWHPAGAAWELAGVKTLSYAPNMAATRVAEQDGYDDALLIGRDGQVLELPTSSIAWVHNDIVETPALRLGILDSITRRVALELCAGAGIPAREGEWGIERLFEAAEVMVWSTVREVTPVSAVDHGSFDCGPVTTRLADDLRVLVEQELGAN